MICICKDPLALGVVHRSDAPCYIPEQRTWVGLTDADLRQIILAAVGVAEAKLKEKNT